MIERALAELQAAGSFSYRTYHLGIFAEALAERGQLEQGRRVLDESIDLAQRNGERFWLAELHRLRGEMLLRSSGNGLEAREKANHDFRQALAISEEQQSKSLRLRAATSLARLQAQEARGLQDAQRILADVYHQFTEGHQTHDLEQARELLDR
jgi:predicted ATPase